MTITLSDDRSEIVVSRKDATVRLWTGDGINLIDGYGIGIERQVLDGYRNTDWQGLYGLVVAPGEAAAHRVGVRFDRRR